MRLSAALFLILLMLLPAAWAAEPASGGVSCESSSPMAQAAAAPGVAVAGGRLEPLASAWWTYDFGIDEVQVPTPTGRVDVLAKVAFALAWDGAAPEIYLWRDCSSPSVGLWSPDWERGANSGAGGPIKGILEVRGVGDVATDYTVAIAPDRLIVCWSGEVGPIDFPNRICPV